MGADFAQAMEGLRPEVLIAFFAGYGVILATPGPNMLAIGTVAALHGYRAALPICLGVATGVGALGLATLVLGAMGGVPVPGGGAAGRILGALLLLGATAVILRSPRTGAAARLGRGAGFGAGFLTAVTNPMTGAYFAAQALGPLGGAAPGPARWAIPVGVAAMALGSCLLVALLLARAAGRRAVLAWARPVRRLAAALLLGTAGAMVGPLLPWGPATLLDLLLGPLWPAVVMPWPWP